MNLAALDQAILNSLATLNQRHGKKYCYPSQASLVKWITRIYGIKRCRRTLNYHLRRLEDAGYLRRIRRIKKGPGGLPQFASTVYVLGKKGVATLGRMIDLLARTGLKAYRRFKDPARQDFKNQVENLVASIAGPGGPHLKSSPG